MARMKAATAVAAAATLAGAALAVRAAVGVRAAIGASVPAIRPYAAGSVNYRDGRFHNTEPSSVVSAASASSLIWAALTRGRAGRPRRRVPLATPLAPADAAELAVTWFGHASVLIELDGYRILTDPVWSRRVSPSAALGPARLHPVPVALETIPAVDAIVISHDHYDHLDKATVALLVETQEAPFLVPTGIGAHLRGWNVPEERIIELDWGASASVGDLRLTCTEARHFSGRGLIRNTTLWGSWVFAGPRQRVFFGGDTGYSKCFSDIGATYGPFALTLLPIGAYGEQWPDIHMNPEEAVQAHADLNGGDARHSVLLPIHWGTFDLAFHRWAEPVERVVEAAGRTRTPLVVPMPGQRVVPALDSQRAESDQWWKSCA